MIGLILFGFGFVLGMLHGQGKLIPWVRGAAGKARDVAFGPRPAARADDSATAQTEMASPEVSPTPPKNPIRAWKAIGNILAFFGGLLAWAAKNPVAVLALAVLALWLTVGASCSGPFGKSKDALRLEREIAEMNETIRAHEARVSELSRDLAVNTERDRTRRTQVITQAQQEIEDATAEVDPEAQYAAYVRGYICVLDPRACANSADPAPSRTPPVRSPAPDAA
jgi:hypothetical protein